MTDPYGLALLPIFPLQEYDSDLVRELCIEEVENTFRNLKYENLDKNKVITELTSNILTKIAPESKGTIKYITHCTIAPKTTGPIDVFSNNFWDPNTDGMSVVNYENDDMRVIFTIWGIQTKKEKK